MDGCKLIVWGLFKKVAVADNVWLVVNRVYADVGGADSAAVVVAGFLFVFQVYCDFSAYSDIAVGSARILGVQLSLNFNKPFTSRSTGELWTRWHLTLVSWMRQYVYLPLGGSRVPWAYWVRNLVLVYGLMGLWHGAAWTFVFFGLLPACFIILGGLTKPFRQRLSIQTGLHQFPKVERTVEIIWTVRLIFLHRCVGSLARFGNGGSSVGQMVFVFRRQSALG